jgi:hypothetical protein
MKIARLKKTKNNKIILKKIKKREMRNKKNEFSVLYLFLVFYRGRHKFSI